MRAVSLLALFDFLRLVPASWSRPTEEDKEDMKLEQTEFDEIAGSSVKDPEYLKFLTRIQARGGDQADQCLRSVRVT
jgi:hypothetical protein